MRGRSLPVLALAALVLAAGAAHALPAERHVTLEADDGESCLDQDALDCFREINDTLEGVPQGATVHLTVENVGDNPHNAYATEQASADEDTRDTSADDAINGTDTADPGSTVEMTFEVPDDADGLYVWCDVQGHEAAGMYLTADVENATAEGNGTDNGGQPVDDEGQAPDGGSAVPGPSAPVAALVAALAARARRA
jgi:uncharacterized cupredoxin-like copper-binding protein